jgi:hypothetical protein
MTHFITLQNDTEARRVKIERGGITGFALRGSDSLRIWEQDGISTHDEDGRRIDLDPASVEAVAAALETAGWRRVITAAEWKEI